MTMSFAGVDIPISVTGVWAFVTTITTAVFYWKKERNERSVARAEKLNQILQKLEADDVASTFYSHVEHGDPCFENGSFKDTTVERSVDKMLNWFSYLCYLRRKHIITRSEFEEFAYWITRSLANDQIQEYLECLYDTYDVGVDERPFRELVRYGRGIGLYRIDVIWSNYMAKMPWWQRVSDWTFQVSWNVCRYFRSHVRQLQGIQFDGREDVADSGDLKLFRDYLNRNYTVKSASAIFTCATGVSTLLGKALNELASKKDELEYSLGLLEQRGQGRWANLSNYRNALKTYFKYSQGIERTTGVSKGGDSHDRR